LRADGRVAIADPVTAWTAMIVELAPEHQPANDLPGDKAEEEGADTTMQQMAHRSRG